MPNLNDLSSDQFIKLLDEYYAPPQKRQKLTQEQIKVLAEKLNKKIDIPIASETKESKIFFKVVLKVDSFLYDNLPNEFYDLIHSSEKGISEEEADRLSKRLAKIANDKINIPYIPEFAEKFAFTFIIKIIMQAAVKQWDLITASEEADRKMIAPKKPNSQSNSFDIFSWDA